MTEGDPNLRTSAGPTTHVSNNKTGLFSKRVFPLVLGAALFAAFPSVWLGAETFFFRDFGAQVYPALYYLRQSILSGEIPLWNPYNHCGLPFMAQWSYWYPGNLMIVLLPVPWSANLFLLVHLFLGGSGMYWLCRRLGVGGFAASFAGMAYVFNGVSVSCLMWTSYTASLAWLPWVLGCTMAAWRSGGRAVVLAALAAAVQVLAGTPEITLLFWIFLGLVWLGDVASREVPISKSFLRLVGVVILAAGVTMVQMLPFVDLLAHSQRDRNYGGTAWSMPGWGWGNFLVPLFHCYQSPQGQWFQPGQDLMNSYYLGAGVLALAIAGVWLRRGRLDFCIAGFALFCWIIALGTNGVVFDWVKRACPAVGIVRFPVKFAVLPVFLIPLVAVAAIERLLEPSDKRARRVLITLAVAFLVLMAVLVWFARQYPFLSDNWAVTARNAGWRALLMAILLGGLLYLPKLPAGPGRAIVQLALLAILPVDALTHNPKMFPVLPTSFLAGDAWTAGGNPPPPKLGEGRLMISPEAEQRLSYSLVKNTELDFTSKRLGEWYNLNLLDRIPKVSGASLLRPAHFDIIQKYAYFTDGSHIGQGLLDFLSVAWISSPQDPVRWSSRTNHLPLVTGGQRPSFASDEKTLAAICADSFDPRQTVYLPESERALVNVAQATDCRVSDVRFTGRRIDMRVAASDTSLVVISQSFYHLWRAFVDGSPARLMRANLAFQAVEVPAGNHHVNLVYEDQNFRVGAIVSLVFLALCGLIWFRNVADNTQSEKTPEDTGT